MLEIFLRISLPQLFHLYVKANKVKPQTESDGRPLRSIITHLSTSIVGIRVSTTPPQYSGNSGGRERKNRGGVLARYAPAPALGGSCKSTEGAPALYLHRSIHCC